MSSLCFNFREVCAAAVTQRGRVARQAVARYSSTLCKSKPRKKGLIWSHLRGFILATQIERIGASLEEVPVRGVHRQFWGN